MVVHRVIDRLRQLLQDNEISGIVSAYLFGSHARGGSHSDSDIDLGVLLERSMYPHAQDRFDQRLRLISLLGSPIEPAIDLVILNDVHPSLGRAVASGGELVFCSDAEKNHQWVRDVQLMAADLDPFLDRMRRIKLEALTP